MDVVGPLGLVLLVDGGYEVLVVVLDILVLLELVELVGLVDSQVLM